MQFEAADLLFSCDQMSVGKINKLLNIWAALLTPHNDEPPFKDHSDLNSTINATPLPGGDADWKSFALHFAADEELPLFAPNWKKMKWDVWYIDPQELYFKILIFMMNLTTFLIKNMTSMVTITFIM